MDKTTEIRKSECGEVSVTFTTARMPSDINRFVASSIKALGLPVVGTKAQLLVDAEPGRTWIKRAEKSSVTTYG